MKKIVLSLIVISSVLFAGGYRIPEVSTNAVALSSANVAHNKNADASYYNPANMAFMNGSSQMELGLTYIGLDAPNYKPTTGADIDAEKETFLVPSLHYVSPEVDGVRFGLSIVSPGGLTKRWETQPAQATAEEFTLQTIEVNPTIAHAINDKVSIATGLRIVHTSGIVKAQIPTMYSQELEGDSLDFGYNVALAYKATPELDIALTYRSKIDLNVEGDADVFASAGFLTFIGSDPAYAIDPKRSVDADVSVPLPASLNVALAYTLPSKTTIEVVYERTFWSAYEELNFNFDDPYAEAIFGGVKTKAWQNVNAYRLGVTQKMGTTTLMAGFVYDETPVPDATLGFELPDSDAMAVSFGGRYEIDKFLDVGMSMLYVVKEERTVKNDEIEGEFSNSNAILVSFGAGYKF